MRELQSFAVLNDVKRDRLGQVLARVLEKMASNESEAFTAAEKDQLGSMLALADAQIDEVVAVATDVFTNASTFGQIDRNLLTSRGVQDNALFTVEKAWRKKGRVVAEQIAAHHSIETPSLELQGTDWRLHLQMGSNHRSGQSEPTAIFQLDVADKSSATNETERLDVEFSHAELRALFLQLNAIQAELDALGMPSAAA
ncbi:COMM domain-containing protein 10 [Phytophthora boehmeriae]|uniref:COMM domain-containing protein 10 n=1 Tax=Phytophthora boehmeriae TaxID=109152 RepID=A0A8T1WNM0_9STRA|nr:COMM domain-containing protein 10 [Phytophthora boehmeriae]